eukprot:TRINITY_DN8774_c0_g1_i1.p1 TRINITY_DN8774_c0_g1~~TRINITY_DN8774_c0_g1_i1.p1  ORF type:complete len:385 (-),score=133.62 TRINITY_DN8774_c0_g1_i1:57-1211(-)
MFRKEFILKLIILIIGFSLVKNSIVKQSCQKFGDSSDWLFGGNLQDYQLWVSNTTLYFTQPVLGGVSNTIKIIAQIQIPDQYRSDVWYGSGYNIIENSIYVLAIPRATPTTFIEFQISIPRQKWSIYKSITLEKVTITNDFKWQLIYPTAPTGALGTLFIFSLDYACQVSYANFQYLSTTKIANGLYDSELVYGAGHYDDLSASQIFLARGYTNSSKSGQIVNLTGRIGTPVINYDFIVYTDTSPLAFFVANQYCSRSLICYYAIWVQTKPYQGFLNKYDLEVGSYTYSKVPANFQQNEEWTSASAFTFSDPNFQKGLFISTYDSENSFTIRTWDLMKLSEISRSFVQQETAPKHALELGFYTNYAVLANMKNGANQLCLYQYA